jgi:hypothetical protein
LQFFSEDSTVSEWVDVPNFKNLFDEGGIGAKVDIVISNDCVDRDFDSLEFREIVDVFFVRNVDKVSADEDEVRVFS